MWSRLSKHINFDSCQACGSSLPASVSSHITSFSAIHFHGGPTTFCSSTSCYKRQCRNSVFFFFFFSTCDNSSDTVPSTSSDRVDIRLPILKKVNKPARNMPVSVKGQVLTRQKWEKGSNSQAQGHQKLLCLGLAQNFAVGIRSRSSSR